MNSPSASMRVMSRIVAVVIFAAWAGSSKAQSISVSGSPPALRVQSAIAGSTLTSVTDNTTTYAVNTGSKNNQKITAQINSAMPAGVTLTITLSAPSGATSSGPVNLSTTAQNVVTSIPKNTNNTRTITYQLSATTAAGVITSRSRTVTLTVLTGA